MAITLTERAAQHVKDYAAKRSRLDAALRIGVRPSGCSGMAYVFELEDAPGDSETVFDSHGVRIVVDPKSLVYVDGSEVDYVREGLQEGFRFNNPNVKDQCGCGESFTV